MFLHLLLELAVRINSATTNSVVNSERQQIQICRLNHLARADIAAADYGGSETFHRRYWQEAEKS